MAYLDPYWLKYRHFNMAHDRNCDRKVAALAIGMFVALIFAFFLTISAWASPFLVCDPPPSGEPVEYYEIDGLPAPYTGKNIARDESGKYGFKFDLAQLAVGGPWTLTARACHSVWGCSEDSAPYVLLRPPRIGKIVGTIQLVR